MQVNEVKLKFLQGEILLNHIYRKIDKFELRGTAKGEHCSNFYFITILLKFLSIQIKFKSFKKNLENEKHFKVLQNYFAFNNILTHIELHDISQQFLHQKSLSMDLVVSYFFYFIENVVNFF